MPAEADSTRVVSLFSEALEIPAPDRDAFLDRACARDAALRARLRALLSGITDDSGFLESPALALERATEDAPGRRIGPYELVRPLASGGMGAVWLARRADESFDALVALKLIKRGMDTDDILARFRAERQVLANLRHPNIAALLDGGAASDGRPYLVMEYVDGEPIDRACDALRLPLPQRIELFRQICAAVEHAHRATVVHRDIKPANILLGAGGGGVPKLLDFGIAKVFSPDSPQRTTATAHRILTPGYASPEQVRAEPITTATDVYSLGIVLYELLTGARPYNVDTGSQASLERTICDTEPPRPSAALRDDAGAPALAAARATTPSALRRALAGDLDTIILTALRKEPARRYPSVAQLSEDLRRHLAGLPVLARPDTIRYRAGKFVRRNKVLVSAASAVLCALLTGLAISTGMYLRARDANASEAAQRIIAEAKTRDAERLESLAEWRAYSAQIAAALGALRASDVAGARQKLDQTAPALRGWEYRFAQSQLDASTARFTAHSGDIYSLVLSPDGATLLTAGQDTLVKRWDAKTHSLLETIPGFNGSVGTIALSHDGRLLAIPSTGGSTILWDLAHHRIAQELTGHPDEVRAVAFAPGSDALVTGSLDGTAILWERGANPDSAESLSYSRRATLEGALGQVRAAAFSPDGLTLATGSLDTTVHLWDARTGEPLSTLRAHAAGIYSLDFSPDSSRLASASLDRTIRVWNLKDGGPPVVLKGHTERVVCVRFSTDGRLLASASWDRSVRLWDAATGEPIATLLGHTGNVFGLAFSSDGRHLYSTGVDHTVRVWDIPSVTPQAQPGDERLVFGLALAPDESWSAATFGSGLSPTELWLWDLRHNRPAVRIAGNLADRSAPAASPDGTRLAAVLEDNTVALWDAGAFPALLAHGPAPGQPAATMLFTSDAPVHAIAFSPDGRRLAGACDDNVVRIWDLRSAAPIARCDDHRAKVRAIAYSPDGAWLASASEDGAVHIHDLRAAAADVAARELLTKGPATALAFSADSQWLALGSGGADAVVSLYSCPDFRCTARMRGHTHSIFSLTFSPGGDRLVSGSMDHTVRLWSPARAQEAATLYGNDYAVFAVSFAQGGRTLLVGSAGGITRHTAGD